MTVTPTFGSNTASMTVGLVWPMPFNTFVPVLDAGILHGLQATKATHIRTNADYRNPYLHDNLAQIADAGFQVLPILDLDYARPDLAPFIDFSEALLDRYRFGAAEVLNEPKTMHGMPSAAYRTVLEATGARLQRFRPATQLYVAGDFLRFDCKGPKVDDWLKDVRPRCPEHFDAIAVHPYREPGPPAATRFGDRLREYDHYRTHFYGLPLVVTEVGWNLAGVSEQQQADYVAEELRLNAAAGIAATFIYAHISGEHTGFGVLGPDCRPRPVVEAIARFQEQNKGA